MALIPIIQQTWDTTSYVNPTRMNNIETNIGILSKATGIEYSTGVSVKDKIDDVDGKTADDIPYNNNYSIGDMITSASNNLNIITPKGYGGNIDTQAKLDSLPTQSTIYAWVMNTPHPFGVQNWATIQTVGVEGTVKNQTFISVSGIAFRHWESGSWGAWKKVAFT